MQRVLVVDDLPEVRRRISAELLAAGLHVVEAADGAEALAALEGGPVGVVISDVRMPRIDGIELLRALRASGTPVILHSGYQDVETAVEGLRLGAVDFLPAPLDMARLRARVEHCLRRTDSTRDLLLGTSPQTEAVRRAVARLAGAREPVLITGETGTGKEVVARALHRASGRGPFVAVSCCALADGTLESELFGHERGAFTGARERRAGRFEQAHGGSLFLDEIGDAPPRVQAELLRVVETGSFERVGGSEPIRVDVRILAATHRELPVEVAAGRFREDLWYRLCALRIHVPPLRERAEDIEVLARHELERLSAERGSFPFELADDGYRSLRRHPWRGNVRELLLSVRRMAILAGERRLLDAQDVDEALRIGEAIERHERAEPRASRASHEARERERILDVLDRRRWNISAAARELGWSRGMLRGRMERLGIGK
jgi:two-component system response regulator AtoC